MLQQFPGVGRKVADCVSLMGLGHLEAVPVDVHISRLAVRDYGNQLPHHLASLKTLSASNYKIIGTSLCVREINGTRLMYRTITGDHFRTLFGEKAGWTQAV